VAGWALRRLALGMLLLWLVATATFVLVSLAPGDTFSRLADNRISPAVIERWRRDFGLGQSIAVRYWSWLRAAATLDLGTSWLERRPVTTMLAEAVPNTALLAGLGMGLEIVGGIILALVQIRRPHGHADRILTLASLTAYGAPTFGVAVLLVHSFAYGMPLLPASHMHSTQGELSTGLPRALDLARHLVLPVLTIGITGMGAVSRYLRGSLLDEQVEHYVLAARARGCSRRRATLVHAFPNACIPLITMVGMSLPFLVSGSLVVEVVFSWPGMGQLMYNAAFARDVPLLMGGTLVASAAVVIGNFLADLMHALIDPRVRM
jgi:peptide/nickel transport system permease protein